METNPQGVGKGKNMMTRTNPVTINTIILHPGVFHSDDVLVAAMLREINPDIEILRTADRKLLEENKANKIGEASIIVADIGGDRYDHHQQDAETRETGDKFAACGLVFRDIKGILFPTEHSADRFEQKYILPIEAADNGKEGNPLSCAISSFVPNWDSDESMDEAFLKAVDCTQKILKREIETAKSELKAEEMVEEAYNSASDKKAIILPRFIPWQNVLCQKEEPCFVVFSGARGDWNVQCVPDAPGSFGKRKELPKKWLEEKPEGCTFVHANLFLAAFKTKEDAVKATESIF